MKARAARRAFTLIELLISITLLTIVGGAIASAIAIQWRSHDALVDADRARQAVRDGAEVMLAELRALSPAGGDLVTASDSALEVRATIGAAVICSVSVARDRVTIPPRRPALGDALTWWRDAPVAGDSLAILDPRAGLRDTVSRHELVAIGGGVCPFASGFTRSTADAARGRELTIAPPLPTSIGSGAPLRFLRRARYSNYRSAADGRWYFGIKELLGNSWGGVQPVAGPLAPAAAAGAGGMEVVIRDRAGAVLSVPPFGAATEVEITFRANGSRPARALGWTAAVAESLVVSLSPRNE
jgi:prepilin-type N-terminal cleavage/methylation domain-containing protein